ncbi:MAG: CarD family transcriptional regulator [Pseudomonadota bacterium]
MVFKVGDKAVYPAHGVGEIISIENKNISGTSISFYVMKILGSDMTIMIPVNNVEQVGLRSIIPPKKVTEVYAILKQKNVSIDMSTWNRRYREYMKKIKTGSVFEISEVLRDLFLLKNEKTLSFGEKKMLETAKSLLVKEISIAKRRSEKAVEKDLKEIFGRAE